MKIAVPTSGGTVDEHFGHCESFTIFTADEHKKILSQEQLTPPQGCGCKSEIIPMLSQMGVSVMLAGNMGEGARIKLEQNGINVFRGCSGDAKKTVESWLAGNVADSGQGCQSHKSCG
jgi:predicted Fe-Mo cluster-binding NifX family protein